MSKAPAWNEEMQIALRSNFTYDPDLGIVSRRFTTKRCPAGPLTSRSQQGDLQTNFLWRGKVWNLRANRLAYFLATGYQPAEVHFIDYDKNNLKFKNLRPVYSRDQVTEKVEPVDYAALARLPEPPLTISEKTEPTPGFGPVYRKPPLKVDEYYALMVAKGNAQQTALGGVFTPHEGEILPIGYTYLDKDEIEQARLRAGWRALIYWKLEISGYGMTQAQLDADSGKTLKYAKTDMVSPAYDVDAAIIIKQHDERAAPSTEVTTRWGDPADLP